MAVRFSLHDPRQLAVDASPRGSASRPGGARSASSTGSKRAVEPSESTTSSARTWSMVMPKRSDAAASRVVADHPADGGAVAGRGVRAEHQPERRRRPRSSKWPRCPIRKTRAGQPSSARRPATCRSGRGRRARKASASWPVGQHHGGQRAGVLTLVERRAPRGPRPRTAARVAATSRWWRAKTFSADPRRPASRSAISQAVEQVGGRGVGPHPRLVGRQDRRPVPERALQPGRRGGPPAPCRSRR